MLIDGFVAGMWRLERGRDAATLTVELFGPQSPRSPRSPRSPHRLPGTESVPGALAGEAARVLAFAAPGAAHRIRFAPPER